MYDVITTITPITYVLRLPRALDGFNSQGEHTLTPLQSYTLIGLNEARTALRYMQLMRSVKDRINTERFNEALKYLVACKYIHRRTHGKTITYSITVSGRAAVADLNQRLIDLCKQAI